MPIHGLTTGTARWPRIGVLRKGEEKPNEKQPGKDLEKDLRFVGADAGIEHDFATVFGGLKIDQLTVRLPYADVDSCWQNWNEEWVSGGLVCRCNGIEHVLWRMPDGEYSTDPRPCPGRGQCKATQVGRLEVIIPNLGRMGTVTVLTTSRHDIANIDGCLRAVAMAFGDLTYVPLRLSRVPRTISAPETEKQGGRMVRTGRRLRRTKWLLHIEAEPAWVRHMIDARGRPPLELTAREVHSLPAPEPSDGDHGDLEGVFDAAADLGVVDPLGGGVRGEAIEGDGDAPLEPDHWTPEVAACGTVAEVMAVLARTEGIEPLPKRENVRKLCYRRALEIVQAALDAGAMSAAALRRAEEVVANLPANTPGKNAALDRIIAARDALTTGMIVNGRAMTAGRDAA